MGNVAIFAFAEYPVEHSCGAEQTNMPAMQWRQRSSTDTLLPWEKQSTRLAICRRFEQQVLDLIQGNTNMSEDKRSGAGNGRNDSQDLLPVAQEQISESAAWLAIVTTVATILLLASLHVLSPEFSPSWRVISEYALGHYAWVLSLMFLSWGISSWALVVAIWSEVHTTAGKLGLWLLIVAGVARRWPPLLTSGTK